MCIVESLTLSIGDDIMFSTKNNTLLSQTNFENEDKKLVGL